MVKISRALIAFAAVFTITAVFLSMRAFAEYDYSRITGTNASGAAIEYDDVIDIDILDFDADPSGEKDSAPAFQKALSYAHRKGTDRKPVRINIPKGTYNLKKTLYIFSNTWISADKEAYMIRNHAAGSIMRNYQEDDKGSYDADRNIIIDGGVWDGRPTASSYEFSNMRFGHMSDLIIRNAVIKNNYNGHHIELGGVRRVTIENCEICGFTGADRKEAIQLDTMINESVFNSYAPFDNTPCDNVVIRNCNFHDLDRAVGSHSGMMGVYYTNIVIAGNKFKDLSGSAIPMINYKNCIIENNDISDCGTAIDLKAMALESMEYYYSSPKIGKDKINDNANIIIRNNTIKNKVTGKVGTPYAIRLYGKNVTGSSNLPDYNFAVRGVKITGNTIVSAGSAVAMVDATGVYVDSNEISFNTDDKHLKNVDPISLSACGDVTVTANRISGGVGDGIFITSGRDNTISSNVISGSAKNAVSVKGSSNAHIESNEITSPASHGIRIAEGCKGTKIMYNKISEAGGHALLFKASSVEAGGNELYASSSCAMTAEEGSVVKYYANSAVSNTNYGIKATGASTVYISTDTFENNGQGNIFIDDDSSLFLNSAKNFGTDNVTSTTVELSWDEISMAESYRIYRRLNNGSGDFVFLAETSETNYDDESALPATRYTYEVVGLISTTDGEHEGKPSDVSLRTHLSISECSSDIPESVVYTGSARTPMFNIYLDGCELVRDVDYSVVFTNNTAVGKARATVLGKGQYCDSKVFEFDIVFGQPGKIEYRPAANSSLLSAYNPSGVNMRADDCTVYLVKAERLERPVKTITFLSLRTPEDYINELKENAPSVSVRNVRNIGGDEVYGVLL